MVEIKCVKENLQMYRLSDHLTVMYDGFVHEVIIVCNLFFSSTSYHVLVPGTSHQHNYIPEGKEPATNSDADSNVSSVKEIHLAGHRSEYRKMKHYKYNSKKEQEGDNSDDSPKTDDR